MTFLGQRRIGQLRKNIRYFRQKLHQIGVIIFGNDNSPVVPLMVYLFSKLHVVLKEFKERNVAVVGVGFPAAPLYMGRLRFCISAGHTKEQLDTVRTPLIRKTELIRGSTEESKSFNGSQALLIHFNFYLRMRKIHFNYFFERDFAHFLQLFRFQKNFLFLKVQFYVDQKFCAKKGQFFYIF